MKETITTQATACSLLYRLEEKKKLGHHFLFEVFLIAYKQLTAKRGTVHRKVKATDVDIVKYVCSVHGSKKPFNTNDNKWIHRKVLHGMFVIEIHLG